MRLRDAILAVRDVTSGGGPVVPGDWQTVPQAGGWYSLRRPDGSTWHAWRAWVQPSGTTALWLVCAPTAHRGALDTLVQSDALMATMVDAWQAAVAGPGLARDVMRRWPDFRITGFERVSDGNGGTTVVAVTDAPRRLIPSRQGVVLPDPASDPMPWRFDAQGNRVPQADAVIRVDTIHAPAFLQTIAGYHDHVDAPETT